MHQLTRTRILQSTKGHLDSRSESVVTREAAKQALASPERLFREQRCPEQMVQILMTRLALGSVERAEHLVEIEVLPGALVECRDIGGVGQSTMVRGGASHVGCALAALARRGQRAQPEDDLREAAPREQYQHR